MAIDDLKWARIIIILGLIIVSIDVIYWFSAFAFALYYKNGNTINQAV